MEAQHTPGAGTVQGLDVSHFQGTIDWNLVAQSGMAFAFIKATEGTAEPDAQFAANWTGARMAGLLRGAYHFYRPSQDPRQQAWHFLDIVQFGPGDLPPVLDVEAAGDPGEIVAGIQTWLAAVEQATGRTPILYTNPTFWAGLRAPDFGRFPLWIANYDVSSPTIPTGWATWSFWQYSENGAVPGISRPVDLDRFQGTLRALRQMATRSSITRT